MTARIRVHRPPPLPRRHALIPPPPPPRAWHRPGAAQSMTFCATRTTDTYQINRKTYSAIRIVGRARGSRCVASTRPGSARAACGPAQAASPAASGGSANPAPYSETAWLDVWSRGVTHLPANGSRSLRPRPILAAVPGTVPATPRPGTRCCQRCAAQGPTPEIRSTPMWVMYPGGGLSIGGKRTSGPR
jgi:hypothetical protein